MDMGNRDHAEALYYHIAGDAIESAVKETDEFRLAEFVCTAMVFSAFTLEAYINQQYASHEETAKLDLRNIEVREKWKMLPLLLGQPQTFDVGGPPYQTSQRANNCGTTRYHACIGDMIRTLNKLTGGRTAVPEGFLNGERYLSTHTVSVDVSMSVEFLAPPTMTPYR